MPESMIAYSWIRVDSLIADLLIVTGMLILSRAIAVNAPQFWGCPVPQPAETRRARRVVKGGLRNP